MNKIADQSYEFEGTRFHLRAFEDPLRIEKPVFVIEEGKNNVHSLMSNRVELAKELAGSLGRSPDEIIWLELSADRKLTQFEFAYTHTDILVPNRMDMSDDEAQAVNEGAMNSDTITRYNAYQQDASLPEFQSRVGDALETYETRQNQEFRRMETSLNKESYHQENEAELAANPLRDYAPDL